MKKNTPFPERDVDAVVSGRVSADPDLAVVQRALSHIKEALIMEPTTETISAQAAHFAAAVPPPVSASHARAGSPWRRRAIAVVAVAVVSGFGVAGAAAANEAAPGDPLYGLDQGLERIGILNGGVGERLQEADVLAQRGDVDGAVELTTKALNGDGQHEAAVALERAAVAVKSQSSGNDTKLQVSTMLQWMSQQQRGEDFGAKVAERARVMEANAYANANQSRIQDQTKDQAQDQTKDQTKDQTRDQAQDQTRDQAQDQTRDQTQDRSASGDGTCVNDGLCVGTGNVNGNVNGSADGTGTGICVNDGACTGNGPAQQPNKP